MINDTKIALFFNNSTNAHKKGMTKKRKWLLLKPNETPRAYKFKVHCKPKCGIMEKQNAQNGVYVSFILYFCR
jgi:hypothetical protein